MVRGQFQGSGFGLVLGLGCGVSGGKGYGKS